MVQKLNTVFVDIDNGVIAVNGKELSNVTAFSMILKDGEYGLKIAKDEFYESSAPHGKFVLDLYPCEICKE